MYLKSTKKGMVEGIKKSICIAVNRKHAEKAGSIATMYGNAIFFIQNIVHPSGYVKIRPTAWRYLDIVSVNFDSIILCVLIPNDLTY